MKLYHITHKIVGKLFFYFSLALILFTLIIGGVFTVLFSNYTTEIQRKGMQKRAIVIADTLGNLWEKDHPHNMMGYGVYLNLLDEIAMSNVWVLDTQDQFVSYGKTRRFLQYEELPEDGMEVIETALTGKVAFSKSFSQVLGKKSVSVGVPIMGQQGDVLGVVLLHAPISDASEAIYAGLRILGISFLLALLLAVPFALFLSLQFTKPLQKMKTNAALLAKGDYSAKNKIAQRDEIGELADSMDAMSQRLLETDLERQRLEKMRQDFTANVSHELRTPVTVLRGSLEAICDGVVTEKQQILEYHQQMLKESIHLERLVNDLLELSRLQSDSFTIEKHSLDVREVVQDAVRSIRRIAEKKQILLEIDGGAEPFYFLGDYARLRQMFLVLLDNAVKFSPEHSTVSVHMTLLENKFCVMVEDEGPGISPEDLPYIFERFHKSQDAENQTGTGLGLAVAKQIALRHQIMLEVSSEFQKGTIFSCWFPPKSKENPLPDNP